MNRTRPRHARGSTGRRRVVAVGSALALTMGVAAVGVAAATSASADTTVTSGSLAWGYKQSFRTYVGGQVGALPPGPAPVDERVVPVSPATFDPASPSVATTAAEAARPYKFPVASGQVTATSADVSTSGGVTYNFPSHGFEYRFSNVRVTVSGGDATVRADTHLNATLEFGDLTPGVYTGNQVVIATGSGAISVAADGGSATVTATGLTLSTAATGTPQTSGDAMDDLSLSVALDDPVTPPDSEEPDGTVTLSKSVFDPAGDTVTVTGTGFLPTVLATTAPLGGAGVPGGIFVRFGKVQDVWQPTAGAAGSTRTGPSLAAGGQFWVLPDASRAKLPGGGAGAGYATLNADGTFQVTLTVAEAWTDAPTGDGWKFGIYTYGASGANSTGYETFTPISFSTTPPPDPEPGEGEQVIKATVPQATPGGDFTWTIDNNTVVDLGTMTNAGAYYHATGQINAVIVTDTRTSQDNSWSISGQLSDFTGGVAGSSLGWTPRVVTAGAGATAGAHVLNAADGGPGLASSQTLGNAADGHTAGSGTLGADLDLKVPVTTPAGEISATLTLTALS